MEPGRIDSLDAARALFAELENAREERLHVAHLSADHQLIGLRMRFGDGERRVAFPIRAIVANALRLNSAALILAHNHPSGDPTPTAMDREMTRALVQAMRPLGITVRDHLIFAGGRVASFRALGLL
jgi:DNA repair protein RadC